MGKLRPVLYFMSKSQLAKLYSVSPQTLRNWINRNGHLLKELETLGYFSYDKVFTPRQIETIFSFLGYPDGLYELEQAEKVYFPVKQYTKQELLDIYKTTTPTFLRYLLRYPQLQKLYDYYLTSSYILAQDVETIFELLGHPFFVKESDINRKESVTNHKETDNIVKQTLRV